MLSLENLYGRGERFNLKQKKKILHRRFFLKKKRGAGREIKDGSNFISFRFEQGFSFFKKNCEQYHTLMGEAIKEGVPSFYWNHRREDGAMVARCVRPYMLNQIDSGVNCRYMHLERGFVQSLRDRTFSF